jgi:hypothetical protein
MNRIVCFSFLPGVEPDGRKSTGGKTFLTTRTAASGARHFPYLLQAAQSSPEVDWVDVESVLK